MPLVARVGVPCLCSVVNCEVHFFCCCLLLLSLVPCRTMMLRSALRSVRPLLAGKSAARCASTLPELLQETAQSLPWREIVKDKEAQVKWSNSALEEHSTAFANGLGELGFSVGDTLVTILPTNAENVVTTFAAASIGVNIVAAAPKTAGQLESLLVRTGAKGVIFSKEAQATIAQLLPEVVDQTFTIEDHGAIDDTRFPALDLVITTEYDLTDNNVINFRNVFMYDNGSRCHVQMAANSIGPSTLVTEGATNQDILAAAGTSGDCKSAFFTRFAARLGCSRTFPACVDIYVGLISYVLWYLLVSQIVWCRNWV